MCVLIVVNVGVFLCEQVGMTSSIVDCMNLIEKHLPEEDGTHRVPPACAARCARGFGRSSFNFRRTAPKILQELYAYKSRKQSLATLNNH
eukprot:611629-Amphidinium_carterae.1